MTQLLINKRAIKLLLFLVLSVISIQQIYSQSNDRSPAPSTPDVAKMTVPAEVDVSHYTGRVNISLPLYTITDGDLVIPISLSYSGGGIRTNEGATKVGLGWNLDVGGVISRSIKGLPDESKGYGYHSDKIIELYDQNKNVINTNEYIGEIINGSGYIEDPLSQSQFISYYKEGMVDCEPDSYTFSIMGHSGKFVFAEKNKLIMQTSSNLEPRSGDGLSALSMDFYDLDGTKYSFKENKYQDNKDLAYIAPGNKNPLDEYFPVASYLTSITTPTLETAIFTYADVLFKGYKKIGDNQSSEYDLLPIGPDVKSFFDASTKLGNYGSEHASLFEPWFAGIQALIPNGGEEYSQFQLRKQKRIRTIETENYIVHFLCHQNTFREDVCSGYRMGEYILEGNNNRIDEIRVMHKPSNRFIKRYVFNYSYFNPQSKESARKRLKLDSIDEIGLFESENHKEVIPIYRFTYEKELDLPSKDSGAFDLWGYPNNNQSSSPLPCLKNGNTIFVPNRDIGYNRRTTPNLVTAGMLESIEYSTGGKTFFRWEANTYSFVGNKPYVPLKTTRFVRKNSILCGSLNPNEEQLSQVINANLDTTYIYVTAKYYYPLDCWDVGPTSSNDGFFEIGFEKDNEYTHKEIMDWMPVLYVIRESDKNKKINNIFKDPAVLGFTIITKDLMQQGESTLAQMAVYGKGNYIVRLKPGRFRTGEGNTNDNDNGRILKSIFESATKPIDIESYFSTINSHDTQGYPGSLIVAYSRDEGVKHTGKFDYTGGARIAKIEQLSSNGGSSSSETYSYELGDGFSSGVLLATPKYVETYRLLSTGVDVIGGGGGMVNAYRFMAMDSNSESTQGSHIAYKKVTKTNSEGYTSYYYTSPNDYDKQDLNENQHSVELETDLDYDKFIQEDKIIKNGFFTSKDHFRGDLIKEEVYSEEGKLLKKIDRSFDVLEDTDSPYIPSGVFKTLGQAHVQLSVELGYVIVNTGGVYSFGRYRLLPYNKRLNSERTVEYINGDSLVSLTSYGYSSNSYLNDQLGTRPISKIVLDANSGEQREEYYTYHRGKIKSIVKAKNGYIRDFYQTSYYNTGGEFPEIKEGLLTKEYQKIFKENEIANTGGNRSKINASNYLPNLRVLKEYEYESKTKDYPTPGESFIRKKFKTSYINKIITNESDIITYNWKDGLLTKITKYGSDADAGLSTTFKYEHAISNKISSTIDHRGIVTYYEYDEFGRLIESYIIERGVKKILQSYNYHYRK